MTEEEWLECQDLGKMARFLDGKLCDTTRKWRLLTVACCQRTWSMIWEPHFEDMIEVLDRYAEGEATTEEWHAALREHYFHVFHSTEAAAEGVGYTDYEAVELALSIAEVQAGHCPYADEPERRTVKEEEASQACLVRDVFNPFHPVTLDDSWRRTTVIAFAQAIYDDRAFDRLPILADALEEAGCTDTSILEHCRGPGPHVRGCWVADLLLNKS